MPNRLRLSLLVPLLLLAGAAVPAAASAAWFPADAIDGPSPDIVAAGDVDVARDGGGGVVYLRRDGGVPHVFLSRLVGGVWQAPERVDAGLSAPAGAPTVAAADGGRIVVAFESGDRLFAAFAPGGGPPAPVGAPQQLFDGAAAAPHADVGINGTAYVTFAAGGDVRV
ncbi:MAG TPA: hypothetical protein VF533_06215, partial [Solirubrobacteraceae bacterium]